MKIITLFLLSILALNAQKVTFTRDEASKDLPFPSTSIRWENENQVYSYGNLKYGLYHPESPTLWSFDLKEEQWKKIEIKESHFDKFGGAITWSGKNTLWAFGGIDPFTGESHQQLWAFDIENLTWKQIENKENIPPKRSAAISWETTTACWLFGGMYLDEEGLTSYRNDLWVWDKEREYWKEVVYSKESKIPQPRSQALVWKANDLKLLFLYGGLSREGVLSDLWVCDMESAEWKQLDAGAYPSSLKYTRFDQIQAEQPRPVQPSYRTNSLTWNNGKDFYLWGGQQEHNQIDPLIWKFSFDLNEWIHLIPNKPPSPKYFKTPVVLDNKSVMLLGEPQSLGLPPIKMNIE